MKWYMWYFVSMRSQLTSWLYPCAREGENCGATGLSGLWALEWAWHVRVTNLCCVQGYRI